MTTCKGDKFYMGDFASVEECKTACGRRQPLFTFGRRDSKACFNGKCVCQCEYDSDWKTGQCKSIGIPSRAILWDDFFHDMSNYDLFRYTSKFYFFRLSIDALEEKHNYLVMRGN